MKKFLSAMLVASCAIGWVNTAVAENSDYQAGNWLLAKYDRNGDDRITQDEVSTKKLNIFRRMDSNDDGGVSFAEYESVDGAKRQALLKSRFNKLDSDRDGRVNESEYSSFMGLFASIDSNGDGTLTAEEMNVAERSEAYVTHCLWWFCLRTEMDED